MLGDAQERCVRAFEEDSLQSGLQAQLSVNWTQQLEQLVIARGSNI